MSKRRNYKRRYLWVDQEFYKWVMNSAKKHKIDGSAEVTHRLMGRGIRIQDKVIFGKVIRKKGKWKK